MTKRPSAFLGARGVQTGLAALATAGLFAGCQLPPSQVSVNDNDNGRTLILGVHSEIHISLSQGWTVPTSSNPSVVSVSPSSVGNSGFAGVEAPGVATLTAYHLAPGGGGYSAWRITIAAIANPPPNPGGQIAP